MRKPPLSVARRYARALLDVGLQNGGAETLAADLASLASVLETQPELRRVLTHPAVSADKKRKVATDVFRSAPPLLSRLLVLLAGRDRIGLLPAIRDTFQELWNEHRGVVAAEAVSAAPLADAQRTALTAAATKLAGREVLLKTSVDPSLLGGVVLHMNGRTYDGSLRAQLRALRMRLASGAGTPSSSPQH